MASQYQALEAALSERGGQKHGIVGGDFPDPDFMGSALALQMIFDDNDIESDIIYGGKISHRQNRAMRKILGIEMRSYDTDDVDFKDYDGLWFVDTSGDTVHAYRDGNIPREKVIGVIDHHNDADTDGIEYIDVRRDYGATCTILVEYLQESGLLGGDTENEKRPIVAVGLAMGIKTDTKDFMNARDADITAYGALMKHVDKDRLQRIQSQQLSPAELSIVGRAISERRVQNDASFSYLGSIVPDVRDAMPEAADLINTTKGHDVTVVYARVGDVINGSFRTTSDGIDPGEYLAALGTDENEKPFGGGKKYEGGFKIPLKFGIFNKVLTGELADADTEKLLDEIVVAYVERSLLNGTSTQ